MYHFFFSSRRRHTRWPRDWSSDVCSSDLLILKIENEKIESVEDIKPYIEQAGKNKAPLSLTLKRGEKIITTSVLPVKDEEKNNYSIGLYIRDSAAGIGTLSFYEPKTKKYGALGHVIRSEERRVGKVR